MRQQSLLFFALMLMHSMVGIAQAQARENNISSVSLNVLSAKQLDGVAGDYVTVLGTLTNNTNQPIVDITTYLSLVDTQNKLPVDLEDWSAEKGLFIGSIDASQTLPLNWKVHFVKAGKYNLTVIGTIAGVDVPVTSTITQFNVQPKKNLNPGQVLPVALGMPLVLLIIMGCIQYRRSRRFMM